MTSGIQKMAVNESVNWPHHGPGARCGDYSCLWQARL